MPRSNNTPFVFLIPQYTPWYTHDVYYYHVRYAFIPFHVHSIPFDSIRFHSIRLHDIRHQIFLSFFVHLHIIFHSSGSGIWSRNSTTSAMVFICLKHLTINYPRIVLNSPTTQYDRRCLTSNNPCNKTPKQRQHITPIHLYLYSIKGVQFNLSRAVRRCVVVVAVFHPRRPYLQCWRWENPRGRRQLMLRLYFMDHRCRRFVTSITPLIYNIENILKHRP